MNCNRAPGGKFNDLRSAIGPRGKWVVGFGHANLQIFVAWPDMALAERRSYWPDGWVWSLEMRRRDGTYCERPRRSEMSV
jgi:hypothetical protein